MMNPSDGQKPYIWLRYATQYQQDGQVHTVEIGIPVPLGATMEERERLIKEAEEGMSQLVNHVGQRLPQMLPQSQTSVRSSSPAQPSSSAMKTAITNNMGNSSSNNHSATPANAGTVGKLPTSNTKPMPTTPPAPASKTAPVQRINNRPAAFSAPNTGAHPQSTTPETTTGSQVLPGTTTNPLHTSDIPPTRPNIGASMPMTLGPTLDSSGNLAIPEFIRYINENVNLKPHQAMEVLKVKSLQGINLREALERLRHIMAQRNNDGQQPQTSPTHMNYEATRSGPVNEDQREIHEQPAKIDASSASANEAGEEEEEQETEIIEMRVPPARFDEEEDEPEVPDEASTTNHTVLNELGLPDFTPQQLEDARNKISLLRSMQGAATASAKRLQALRNVIDGQISDEDLQELIFGIWNLSGMHKLKVDQVEVLISWAKQDYFVEELEAVLAMLEEERYARGNR